MKHLKKLKFNRVGKSAPRIEAALKNLSSKLPLNQRYANFRKRGDAFLFGRKRRLRSDRLRYLEPLGRALIRHCDKATGYVYAGQAKLTKALNVYRERKDGKPDVKVMAEALDQLAQMGHITIERGTFNPETGCFDSMAILVNRELFHVYGDYNDSFWRGMQGQLAQRISERTGAKHVDVSATFEQERRTEAARLHQERLAYIAAKQDKARVYESAKVLELKRRIWSIARKIGEGHRQATYPKPRATGWTMAASYVTWLRRNRTLEEALMYGQQLLAGTQSSATAH